VTLIEIVHKNKILKIMKQIKYSELLLRFQTYDKKSCKSFKEALTSLAKTKNLKFSSISLPMKRKKLTVLKSPHVNKKAKEQFEVRLYNGLVVFQSSVFEREFIQNLNALLSAEILAKISFRIK
jgi:small subunit ribosomal protein S10